MTPFSTATTRLISPLRLPVHSHRSHMKQPKRMGQACWCEIKTVEAPVEVEVSAKGEEEEEEMEGVGFTTQEVQSLVDVLCEETDIMELELKLDGSKIKVSRSMNSGAHAAAAAAAVPAAVDGLADGGNGIASASVEDSISEVDASIDETLIYVHSPKVGVLRRALYNKAGKKVGTGPKEGDAVKKDQALCSIEQLGTYVPVLAPQQGEIVGFEVEDGAPVEYDQEVLELLPYFGGHIIGDSKYA